MKIQDVSSEDIKNMLKGIPNGWIINGEDLIDIYGIQLSETVANS